MSCGLSSQQLHLLRTTGATGLLSTEKAWAPDLRLLVRVGLLIEEAEGSFRQTAAGRRYLAAQDGTCSGITRQEEASGHTQGC